MQSNIGLYKKYNITKADGSPVDPSAQYFILCPTTDLHARTALRAYADADVLCWRTAHHLTAVAHWLRLVGPAMRGRAATLPRAIYNSHLNQHALRQVTMPSGHLAEDRRSERRGLAVAVPIPMDFAFVAEPAFLCERQQVNAISVALITSGQTHENGSLAVDERPISNFELIPDHVDVVRVRNELSHLTPSPRTH